MKTFSPVTDADLSRARRDPAFRQKLLAQSLDTLLVGMKRFRGARGNWFRLQGAYPDQLLFYL